MKNLKLRLLALLLAAVMISPMLFACGKKSDNSGAPAATAASAWSHVNTVPAPTNILPPMDFVIPRIASGACAVRKVTSAQGSPPSAKASAKGTALSTSVIFITGTTDKNCSCLKMSFIITSPLVKLFGVSVCINEYMYGIRKK